jgi:hypothetical protein
VPPVKKLAILKILFHRHNKFRSVKKMAKTIPKRACSDVKFLV